MAVKKLSILGSTGSIGTQTLQVVNNLPDKFSVVALAAGGSNIELIKKQVETYKPKLVAISDKDAACELNRQLDNHETEVVAGVEGLIAAATISEVDIVVAAISGVAGLLPTYQAIKAGKDIALANKETLVAAGELVLSEVKKKNVKLLPIDSEHSAIFQCLEQDNLNAVKSIILTASGGAFRDYSADELANVIPEQALKHPNWNMGKKITVDSASLMNKGLEVIEAHWLFSIDYQDIEVVIHPQSVIHSMVRYSDGSILAHLGVPDMRVAIQYALTWPKRCKSQVKQLDFVKLGEITFKEPRWDDFPCLKLAYEAGKAGGNIPAALNGANEAAVEQFLAGYIKFNDIPKLIAKVMESCSFMNKPTLEEIIYTDGFARKKVQEIVSAGKV